MECLSEERALGETLQAAIQHTTTTLSVGLGSGKSDLQHEYHAFLHSLLLETRSFQMHFVSNCKGIADATPFFWEQVYQGMSAWLKCLQAKFFGQRFTATCLVTPEGKTWRAKFE